MTGTSYTLVLLRHGQSEWNLQNRFTGWTDVGLTPHGTAEAERAGHMLVAADLDFDYTFTSVLTRAIHTLWIVLDELDRAWLPVERAWQLNERHYGALQGQNKAETAERLGQEQVHTWRRSFAVPPPPLDWDDPRHPHFDRRYAHLTRDQLPACESLQDTLARLLPYWENGIAPRIQAGERVLIAAHGNSLRALVMHLDRIPADEVPNLNIPTGVPLVYDLDADLNPLDHHYLDDPDSAAHPHAD